MPHIGMNFDLYLDGLSILFSLLITGIGSLVVLYSIGYLSKSEQLGNFLLLFITIYGCNVRRCPFRQFNYFISILGIDFVFKFLLISFWRKKGIYLWCTKSLIITVFGGLSLLGGFILISLAIDSLSLHELIANASEIQHSPLFIFAMVLIMLGAFTKSAQVPFYIWLLTL